MISTGRKLLIGAVLAIVGLVLVITMPIGLINNTQTPVQLETLTKANIKTGMLVEGDIYYNYGAYESFYKEDKYGKKETVGEYYLFQLDTDATFLGYYSTYDSRMDEFTAQADAFYDYLMDESAPMPDPIHVKGYLKDMDSEDKSIYKQYLTQSFDITAAEIDEYSVYMYIESLDDSVMVPVFLGFGVVLMIAGGLILFFFFKKSKQAAPVTQTVGVPMPTDSAVPQVIQNTIPQPVQDAISQAAQPVQPPVPVPAEPVQPVQPAQADDQNGNI